MSANALNMLMKHAKDCWGTYYSSPIEWEMWATLFPSVGHVTEQRIQTAIENDRQKNRKERERHTIIEEARQQQKSKAVHRDIESLQEELSHEMARAFASADIVVPQGMSGCNEELHGNAVFVKWLLRSPEGSFREYFGDPGTAMSIMREPRGKARAKVFSSKFFEGFLKELERDFDTNADECERLKAAYEDLSGQLLMRLKLATVQDLVEYGTDGWSEELNQGFVDKCADIDGRILCDRYADLFALLVLAGIFGPRDYRLELDYEPDESYGMDTQPVKSGFERTSSRHGRYKTSHRLQRVVYDEASTGMQDYITIPDAPTVSLDYVREVRFGREFPNTELVGNVRQVSLLDQGLPEEMRELVSREHAKMRLGDDGSWYLEDWNSSGGTLVYCSNIDISFVIGGKDNKTRSYRLKNGDVIFFAHTDFGGNTDLPSYVFQRTMRYDDVPRVHVWEHIGDFGPAQRDYDERLCGGAYAINKETEEIVVDVSHTKEERDKALKALIDSDGNVWPKTTFLLTHNPYSQTFSQRVKDILRCGAPDFEGSACDVDIRMLM